MLARGVIDAHALDGAQAAGTIRLRFVRVVSRRVSRAITPFGVVWTALVVANNIATIALAIRYGGSVDPTRSLTAHEGR